MSSGLAVHTLLLAVMPLAAPRMQRDSLTLLRGQMAEVQSQLAARAAAQVRAESAQAPRRRGQIRSERGYTLITLQSVPADLTRRMINAADSTLNDFGGIPPEFSRRWVLHMQQVSNLHELAGGSAVRGRTLLPMDWVYADDTTVAYGMRIVAPLAEAYRQSRDSTWSNWLPTLFGVVWRANDEAERALERLAAPDWSTGRECLAGRIASCRLWLGVDADDNPLRSRYSSAEIVHATRVRVYNRGEPDAVACRDGDADACLRYMRDRGATASWSPLPLVPAPSEARASLIRAVRALHGAGAVAAALTDSAGSVGDRLARASGVSEDSLMAEWRLWTLSRGRPERVRASVGDALVALLTSGLLLGLALRSGRWR